MLSRLTEGVYSSSISLKANKLRSFLTMLGVIIGVFSVVTLVSLGKSFQNYITGQFDALGSNLLFVSPGRANFGGDPALSLTRNKLDEKHVKLISTYAKDKVLYVTPSVNINNTVLYKGKTFGSEIIGTSFEGDKIYNYIIDTGRFFSKSEQTSKTRVAIIGPKVKADLFGSLNPIGRSVVLNEKSFKIIGVFKEKGSDYDSQILAPYTSLASAFGIKRFTYINVKVKDGENLDLAKKHIELALLRDLDKDEFSVLSQADILSTVQQILGVLTLGLGAVAAISLLVGGIGIMNIMLVSVTERTREVGLRMALGATKLDIAFQFLIESVLISVMGGILGLLFAYLLSLVVSIYIETQVALSTVLLAFLFSAVVGMVFGTYPAYSASKKNPIEALRYE